MKKPAVVRSLTALFFLAMAVAGLVWHTGWGTLSSFGLGAIAAVCPLGGLEAMVAEGTLLPRALVALAVLAAAAAIAGRFFCGWMCPVPLLRRAVPGAAKRPARVIPIHCEGAARERKASRWELPSQTPYYVLGGTLLSSAVFGFPVFCLICPVGLTFALVIALWHLFAFNEPSLAILLYAGILVLEVFVLRRWCHRLCPLGAVMSLLARLNRVLRPRPDKAVCLRARGENCRACANACPEGIDVAGNPSAADWSRCTKCGECQAACPAGAIHFAQSSKAAIGQPGGITPARAVGEASRCIECGACTGACPEGKPMADVMALVRQGRLRGAGQLLSKAGSLPEICSRVCPTERLCEGACPVPGLPIARIERLVADAALTRGAALAWPRKNCGRVAIVGAGPSGLACAAALRSAGCAVTVYDEHEMGGGLLTYGIPAAKLPKPLVAGRIQALEDAGVAFERGVRVGRDVAWNALLAQYDAVYAACGAQESLVPAWFAGQGCLVALDFLSERARERLGLAPGRIAPLKGQRVAVLGGGDTAMDCLTQVLGEGALSAQAIVRRSALRAGQAEQRAATEAGATFLFGQQACGLVRGSDGRLTGIRTGSGTVVACDAAILAWGARPVLDPQLSALGVQANAAGGIDAAPDGCTANARLFAGGDFVRGPSLTGVAVADGARAARAIQEFLARRPA